MTKKGLGVLAVVIVLVAFALADVGGYVSLSFVESAAPTAVTGSDIVWGDSSAHRVKFVNNGGSADSFLGSATTDTLTNKTFDSGGTGNVLKINGTTTESSNSDWFKWVPPSACYTTVSGNSTGTNGLTVVGASNVPVIQAQTSNTGTNTHTYVCHIPYDSRTTANHGVTAVADVTWFYGVQTTNLGTQSGSNFTAGSITYPAAGASETPSTVTPVAAGGSITLTPVAGSFNTGTTTAGAFYSEKIAFGTPLVFNTDLTDYEFTVTLVLAATSAQVTNSPGFIVHYTNMVL